MRIYGTIKDALLAPESLIDGRGGLEKKATKGSWGGAQPTRSVFGLRQQRRLTMRIRKKEEEKKNPTTHAMNYLIAACSEFASGTTLSFLCAARSSFRRHLSARQAEMLLAVTRSACSTGVAHTFLRISNINEAALGVNPRRVTRNPKSNPRTPPYLAPGENGGAEAEEAHWGIHFKNAVESRPGRDFRRGNTAQP